MGITVVTYNQKVYFAAVGLLALWVGIWGYFIPNHVDEAIPWLVPPLHARFLGAMYLSGTTFMIGGIMSRYYAEVRVMLRVILIWTGMLFIVSLFYLDEFDYSRTQVWIWFGAYIIYPLIALWLMWQDRLLRENNQTRAVLATPMLILILPVLLLQMLRYAEQVDWGNPVLCFILFAIVGFCGLYLANGNWREALR